MLPATHISKDDPPFLIVQGSNDPIVPSAQAIGMDQALKAAGVSSQLVMLEGEEHEIESDMLTERTVLPFFDKLLKAKK